MTTSIVPAILTDNFEEFKFQLQNLAPFFSSIQIDIMDGQFVDGKTFEDIDKINEIKDLSDLELHLMVKHPLQEIEKWENIKNIKKITFHIESADNPDEVCHKISGLCGRIGIALNPETPIDKIKPYLDKISEVLFLTVHPGKQGSQFQPQVIEKIKKLTQSNNKLIISADGGINEHNIDLLKNSGVNIFYIGSALTKSINLSATVQLLKNKIL